MIFQRKRVSAALIARWISDDRYTKEQFAADEQRLRDCSVNVRALEFNAGHEWSSEVVEAASHFLREFHIPSGDASNFSRK